MLDNGDALFFYKKRSNSQIAVVKMTKTRMFPLIIKNDFLFVFKIDTIDQSSLWHLRYGHLSSVAMNLLYTKKLVRGVPWIGNPSKICEGHILGKQHIISFPSSKL